MNDLEMATTDDLLKEILTRFEHAIFCGLKMPVGDQQAVVGQWHGSALVCVGLAQSIGQSALSQCQFTDTDIDEED